MPYYSDGTEACVGDFVLGNTYNRGKRKVVGVVLALKPEDEAANITVAFIELKELPALPKGYTWYSLWKALRAHPVTFSRDDGSLTAIIGDLDTGSTNDFRLIHRE